MDDHRAESPHAAISREASRTRRSRFPWHASTVRLDQNLETLEPLLEFTGANLQSVWNRCPTCLLNRRCHTRAVGRMTQATAYKKIYDLTSHQNFKFGTADRIEPRAAPVQDDEGGQDDEAALCERDAGVEHARALLPRDVEQERLAIDFASATIAQYDFISLPVEGPFPRSGFQVMQILSKETRDVLVKSATSSAPSKREWLVRRLEIAARPGEQEWSDTFTPDSLDVFELEDPVRIDMTSLCVAILPLRRHWEKWAPAEGNHPEQTCLVRRGPIEWRTPEAQTVFHPSALQFPSLHPWRRLGAWPSAK